MSSNDILDVLNVQRSAYGPPKKKKKVEISKKQLGINRELYNLLGENTPAIQLNHGSKFKQRLNTKSKPASWRWTQFRNNARNDGLELKHWVKGTTLPEKYTFEQYNQKLKLPHFDEVTYNRLIKAVDETNEKNDWSFEETQYLFYTCNLYDLRWFIINDRYNYVPPSKSKKENNTEKQEHKKDKSQKQEESEEHGLQSEENNKNKEEKKEIKKEDIEEDIQEVKVIPRSLEDLKERFYSVCKIILSDENKILREAGILDENKTKLIDSLNFDKQKEVDRKKYLERLLARSPAEIAEEESLVIEARRFEQAAQKMLAERASLLHLLDSPSSTGNINQYLTSQGISQLYNALMFSDKTKKRNKQETSNANSSNATISSAAETSNVADLPGSKRASSATPVPAAGSAVGAAAVSASPAAAAAGPAGPAGPAAGAAAALPPGTSSSVAAVRKKSNDPVAHLLAKKLTAAEEAAYGLSYHSEKLQAGVHLRSSKITTYKPTVQTKINTVLNELGISNRPLIITQNIVEKFDVLTDAISTLLETKKQIDKMETEMKLISKSQ